jgi:hypothetical protein
MNADLGKFGAARAILDKRLISVDGENGEWATYCRVSLASRSVDLKELKRVSETAPGLYGNGTLTASNVGWVFGLAGDVDQAMNWLEKAYDERDIILFYILIEPDLAPNVRDSARWKAFMQRPLIKEWRAEHDRVAAELAAGK